MVKRILGSILMVVILLGAWPVSAEMVLTTVVISEIGAYEASDAEWLEVVNRSDASVDLTNWKFYEDKTNHRITLTRGESSVLAAGEYAIIANVADKFITAHPDYVGKVFDSSWSSLNLAGEEVGLKNAAGETIEIFTYLASINFSLQRLDLNLLDYSATNWQEHASGNSAGRANEFPAPVVEEPVVEPTETIDDDAPAVATETLDACLAGLVINEIVSDPASGQVEWLEIFNSTENLVDLASWKVREGSDGETALTDGIAARDFLVVAKPKGYLNNAGDEILLLCDNVIRDQMSYGNWESASGVTAPAPGKGQAIIRLPDGADSDSNYDWQLTTTPTSGQVNVLTAPVKIETKVVAEDPGEEANAPDYFHYNQNLVINEIMPNPEGADEAGEFIEIKNNDSVAVDLVSWSVVVGAKKYRWTSRDVNKALSPGSTVVLERVKSKLALKNSNGEVKLLSPDGRLADKIMFDGTAPSGASYALSLDGVWAWTTSFTPGAENIIVPPNHAPTADFNVEKSRRPEVGETIAFDASDSLDPDGDALVYQWDFGDGVNADGILAEHSYSQAGKFTVVLTILDGRTGSSSAKKTFTIYPVKVAAETSAADLTAVDSSSTKKAKPSNQVIATSLKDARQLVNGSKVKIRAAVAAEPGLLGTQIMYLHGSGMQVYLSKKDWPKLAVGDVVELTGELSESAGEKRIKLSSGAAIKKVGQEAAPVPESVESLNEDNEGHLVNLVGSIIEKQPSKIWLASGDDEVLVYIKKSTGIKIADLLPGQNLAVTGIVSQNGNEYRLLPRYQSDLQILPDTAAVAENIASGPNYFWLWFSPLGLLLLAGAFWLAVRLRRQLVDQE